MLTIVISKNANYFFLMNDVIKIMFKRFLDFESKFCDKLSNLCGYRLLLSGLLFHWFR